MCTWQGNIKKTLIEEYASIRKNGLISIKLDSGDTLGWVMPTSGEDDLIIVSQGGQSIRFAEKDVRPTHRDTSGVRGIKLSKGDQVIGVDVIKKDPEGKQARSGTGKKDGAFLTMSANGFGKKTSLKEYKVQNRGGSGIKTAKVTTKTGKLIVAKVLGGEEEELIAMSKKGQVIRTALKDISALGRQTQGVTIMRLRAGDGIASVTCI